jgi:hypothetical protein
MAGAAAKAPMSPRMKTNIILRAEPLRLSNLLWVTDVTVPPMGRANMSVTPFLFASPLTRVLLVKLSV